MAIQDLSLKGECFSYISDPNSGAKGQLNSEILVIFGWHFGRNDDLINSF